MKKTKINYKLIAAIAILIVAIILIVIFAVKANKSNKKKTIENSELKFEFVSNDVVISELEIKYKNDKVNDAIITYIFDNNEIAKEIAAVYKEQDEYVDVKVEDNKMTMHYNEKEVNTLQNLTKEEIIQRFENQGYVYKK